MEPAHRIKKRRELKRREGKNEKVGSGLWERVPAVTVLMQHNTPFRQKNMWGSIKRSQEGGSLEGEIPFQPLTKSAKETGGINVEHNGFNIITPPVLFGIGS